MRARRGPERDAGRLHPIAAAGITACYVGTTVGLQKLSGVHYTKLNASLGNASRGLVAPVGLATAVSAFLGRRAGARRSVLSEPRRARVPRWAAMAPAIILGGAAATIAQTPLEERDSSTLAAIAAGVSAVGVGEELVFRGYVLDAARAYLDERGAWAVSTVVFGAVHVGNALTGQAPAAAALQAVLAASTGNSLYVARRVSGSLALPVALHALWDFATLAMGDPEHPDDLPAGPGATMVVALVGAGVVAARALPALWRNAEPQVETGAAR